MPNAVSRSEETDTVMIQFISITEMNSVAMPAALRRERSQEYSFVVVPVVVESSLFPRFFHREENAYESQLLHPNRILPP
jgi:hypothetical protein